MSRLVVLCSKSRADFARRVTGTIADRCVGFCETAGQNMPRDAFERIVSELQRLKADGFIVVGGGSPIGLAKAAAAATKIPYIAIVTTYSGSEMAARWYIGVADNRVSGEGPEALPATAIYDPELTLDLPLHISAASGMNAMAHAVESLYGIDTNPVVKPWPRKRSACSARVCRGSCKTRAIFERGATSMYGAWLAANFRAEVGLEHAIAQRVRQWFNLDHAQIHAIATPYAIGFNAEAAPDAMARIKRALGVTDAARGLYDLNVRLGLPTGLKALGMREEDIGKAIEVVSAAKIRHPKPLDEGRTHRRYQSGLYRRAAALLECASQSGGRRDLDDSAHGRLGNEMGRPLHPAA